jgi:hypothetical protein
MSSIVRVLGSFIIISILYISSIPVIYALSSFLLTKGVVLRYGLLRDFQRDFYVNGGYRRIWQLQKECVQFDETLIYVPRIGSCRFANPEFDTTLNFTDTGRLRNGMTPEGFELGVAVLGDSVAMGWGVRDYETFANIIQDELKRPVYNLGVSSYGTVRELLRLQESGLADKVDTILIQYSGNDLMENKALYQEGKMLHAKKSFEQAVDSEGRSSNSEISKSIRRAFSFAVEKPIRNLRDMLLFNAQRRNPFSPHYRELIPVLKRFASLLDRKRLLVFCLDEEGFADFPRGKDPIIHNLEFVDVKLEPDDFYLIDGHLNSGGHAKAGRLLVRYLSDRVLASAEF